MANHRAVNAVCQSIANLLESNFSAADFDGNTLTFDVYNLTNFQAPMDNGVSIFLYRVYINGTQRLPPGRSAPRGRRFAPPLPIDLHILLTAWGQDVTLQHTIVGWMMRVLEDMPILPAALMNAAVPGSFQEDESVELIIGELDTEPLLHLWELLRVSSYHISVPYLVRGLRIDSEQVGDGQRVQEREFEHGAISHD